MSNIVTQLKRAQTKSDALHAELETAQAMIVQLQTERDELNASVEKHVSAMAELGAAKESALAEKDATIAAKDTEIAERDAALKAAEQEAGKLQRALDDPAYRDAKAPGEPPVDASGEAGETKTRAQLEAEYVLITDPRERAAFRDAHRAELGLPTKK